MIFIYGLLLFFTGKKIDRGYFLSSKIEKMLIQKGKTYRSFGLFNYKYILYIYKI